MYVQCVGWTRIVIFDITRAFLKSQLQTMTSLSHIWFVAGLACDFVYETFFLLRFLILCCRSYKLLQSCSSFECYAYISISKQVGNFPYLGTTVSECGSHSFVVFISVVCVWLVLLYICQLRFWSKCCGTVSLQWIVFFPILFVFCLDSAVRSSCGLYGICTL